MKKCPFCAELIQDEAVKCRLCGEFLNQGPRKEKQPWYYNDYLLLLMFFCVMPLVIPFIWLNPKYSKTTKIVLTISIVTVTVLAVWAVIYFWNTSIKPYISQGEAALQMLNGK